MLKYTFEMNEENGSPYPRAFEAAMEKLGLECVYDNEIREHVIRIKNDYEIATIRSRAYENEICANELTGPGSTVLDLIGKYELYKMCPEHEWDNCD